MMTHESGFDFSELLRGDSEKMADLVRTLSNTGIININEGRRMVGLNTIAEDWAKKHWIQLNMAGAEDAERAKYQKPKGKEKKSEPETVAA